MQEFVSGIVSRGVSALTDALELRVHPVVLVCINPVLWPVLALAFFLGLLVLAGAVVFGGGLLLMEAVRRGAGRKSVPAPVWRVFPGEK